MSSKRAQRRKACTGKVRHSTSAIKRPTHVTLGGTPLFERTEATLQELSLHEEVPF